MLVGSQQYGFGWYKAISASAQIHIVFPIARAKGCTVFVHRWAYAKRIWNGRSTWAIVIYGVQVMAMVLFKVVEKAGVSNIPVYTYLLCSTRLSDGQA